MLRPPILVNTTLIRLYTIMLSYVRRFRVLCRCHRDGTDARIASPPVFCCVLAVLTLPADCASVGHGVWGNDGPGWSLTVGRSGLVVRAVSVSCALLGGVVA